MTARGAPRSADGLPPNLGRANSLDSANPVLLVHNGSNIGGYGVVQIQAHVTEEKEASTTIPPWTPVEIEPTQIPAKHKSGHLPEWVGKAVGIWLKYYHESLPDGFDPAKLKADSDGIVKLRTFDKPRVSGSWENDDKKYCGGEIVFAVVLDMTIEEAKDVTMSDLKATYMAKALEIAKKEIACKQEDCGKNKVYTDCQMSFSAASPSAWKKKEYVKVGKSKETMVAEEDLVIWFFGFRCRCEKPPKKSTGTPSETGHEGK